MSNQKIPTITHSLIFHCKTIVHQINRARKNLFDKKIKQFSMNDKLENLPVIAESKTPLWFEGDEEEKILLAGKIHNLRIALRKLNGIEITANEIFSFWAQIGRASKWKGYVKGRELREGCIIPNIGGGLCQLSNALYDAALKADFEIIERHAHTQIVQGSLAEIGRDATVFWNYIDLRFCSSYPFRIEAVIDAENLIVRFKSDVVAKSKRNSVQTKKLTSQEELQNCFTCGVDDCFRSIRPNSKHKNFGRTAFLVDEFFPEFDSYIQASRNCNDLLVIPIDGKRFKKANYAWTSDGFNEVRQSYFSTLIRSIRSRKLARQGAMRQLALLDSYRQLANTFSRSLKFDVTHVLVMQNLLPFLWSEGHLGGRTFDVLMTALPMKNLHERLDFAARLHPESKTLSDFRANDWLIEAENEALKHARNIITPHTEIATLFPDKTILLDWKLPLKKNDLNENEVSNKKIVFPASTVGRKGAYEIREALQGMDVKLVTVGSQLEDKDFWHGISVEHKSGIEDWLQDALVVVLPAFVENKPRRLLQAIAQDVPVIASTACGIENVKGVINVPVGNVEALRLALCSVIERNGIGVSNAMKTE